MHKNATKCNKTQSKWCINKHGASKIIDTLETYQRSVNKNLVTIGCTEAEKVSFAAHLLEGPATSWWENYQITHPIEEVNWDMFQEAFCIAHISYGVMSLKKREFLNFRQ
jgi:hypothetical protein